MKNPDISLSNILRLELQSCDHLASDERGMTNINDELKGKRRNYLDCSGTIYWDSE